MAGRRDPVLASWNGHQGMSLVEGLLSASPDQDGIWDLALTRQLGKQCHKNGEDCRLQVDCMDLHLLLTMAFNSLPGSWCLHLRKPFKMPFPGAGETAQC